MGSHFPRVMAAHSVSHHKKIRQISYRIKRGENIVFVGLPKLSDIRC